MNIEILGADKSDRDFILTANKEIDQVSGIESSDLSKNLDLDFYEKHLCEILIAKVDGVRAGMALFGRVYWADRGQGVYLSQMFVEGSFRQQGVFKTLLKAVFDFYPETQFVCCLVGKDNFVMQKCVDKMEFEGEKVLSFVKNK